MTLWLKDDLASKQVVVYRAIFCTVVTLFVLFVFQPFGTINDTNAYKFLRLSGYGLVTFCALLLSGLIEIALAHYKVKKNQRLLTIPLIYIAITAIFNHSYFVVAVLGSWSWINQLMFIVYTLAIGILPIGFIFFTNKYATQIVTEDKQQNSIAFSNSSQNLNDNYKNQHQPLTLTGDNKGDKLTVAVSQIVFIQSADNYCELAIIENNNVSIKLLRTTLTNLLKQLPEDSQMLRCHRSYAVNTALVEQSIGNAAGLQLKMKLSQFTVPVARRYVDVIKQALLFSPND